MYRALELLLAIAFYGLGGNVFKGANDFLGASATLIAALVAGAMLITAVDQRQIGALGFAWTKQSPREIAAGYGVGGGAMLACTIVMLAAGALSYRTDAGTASSWVTTISRDFAVLAIAAAAEEVVFRGYGFQVLVRSFGPVTATVGTAALFAYAHMGNPNVSPFALVNIFLAGLLLGLAYLRTMSLWFATAVHAGWNWVMASLLDLPVSGLSMFHTPLYEPVNHGAAWIGGGSFGPEGGIAGTTGLVAGIVALGWLIRMRVAPEMAALRPIALAEHIEESQ